MSQHNNRTVATARAPLLPELGVTRALLACGIVGGALFIVVSLAQAVSRPGFNVLKQPLSLLLLGDLGWIQVLNFIGTGLLAVAFALGARRLMHPGPAGTWGPVLLSGFGLGLIIAGTFHPDPALGFPPGTPAGTPTSLSWHNWLHTIGFLLSFTSLTAACFVFSRRFDALRQQRWAMYCIATGVVTPLLIAVGIVMLVAAGPAFALAGALGTWWVAAVAARLMADLFSSRLRGKQEQC
jgi:hypothetical membrane protein